MARYPKPAEGSWTQHYPHLGTEPVSYEDSDLAGVLRAGAGGDLQAGVAEGRAGRADPPDRKLLHQGDRRGGHVDHRRARRRTVRSGRFTTSAGTGATSWSGTTSPGRRRAGRPASSCASTTGGATASTAPARSRSRRASSSTWTRRSTGWCRCTATSSPGSSSSTSRPNRASLCASSSGPMLLGMEDYPFGEMTDRYGFKVECRANWKVFSDAFMEFYHAPVVHVGQHPAALRRR